MHIQDILFVGSFPKVEKCPVDFKPEYAFIGRSNVGKSSLINTLTGRTSLAKTSKKPGKTQMINYFLIEKSWYIVDLPGYGYAKVSKKHRDSFRYMIDNFILHRRTLVCTFVLIDSNIPPQKIDLEFIDWLGKMGIPFAVIFTKIDRPNQQNLKDNTEAFKAKLLETWEELPTLFYTSSETKEGREEVLNYIVEVNKQIVALKDPTFLEHGHHRP